MHPDSNQIRARRATFRQLHAAGCFAIPNPARWLAGLALLQFVTGLSNVVLDWPLVAAVLHTGGAAALVVVLTWALTASRATAGATASQPRAGADSVKRVSA